MINENRDLYEHIEHDYDENYYYFMNREVKAYPLSINEESKISRIILQWREEIGDNGFYLIGNYLYFTYKGNKYFVIISNFSYEWEVIEQIIEQLSNIVEDLYYNYGRID